MYHSNTEGFKKLPVVSSINSPEPFTPEEPIIIPLLGGWKLSIGKQQHYVHNERQEVSEAKIVIEIHAPSHRSQDQIEGKQFECEVTLIDAGSTYGANIDLLHKEGIYPNVEETKQLNEARKYMALFDPVKDIDWVKLTNPTEQQNIVLQQAGFHPPQVLPTT